MQTITNELGNNQIKQIQTKIVDNRSDNSWITHTVQIRTFCGIASVNVDFFVLTFYRKVFWKRFSDFKLHFFKICPILFCYKLRYECRLVIDEHPLACYPANDIKRMTSAIFWNFDAFKGELNRVFAGELNIVKRLNSVFAGRLSRME